MIIPAIKDLCAKADAAEEFRELRSNLIGLFNLKDGANNSEIVRTNSLDLVVIK